MFIFEGAKLFGSVVPGFHVFPRIWNNIMKREEEGGHHMIHIWRSIGIWGPWSLVFMCFRRGSFILTSDPFLRFLLTIYMLQVQCHSKMCHNYAWLISYSCFSPASIVSIMVGRKHYFMDIWTILFHIMDSYGNHVHRNFLAVAA